MSVNLRAFVVAIVTCALVLGCRDASTPQEFETAGRNPAVLIASDSGKHVVFIDAVTRRLMHQRIGERAAAPISPVNDVVDLRGENAPLFVERPDRSLLVVYPIALPGGS